MFMWFCCLFGDDFLVLFFIIENDRWSFVWVKIFLWERDEMLKKRFYLFEGKFDVGVGGCLFVV